jgi:uncharacterized repeat protein (TIGR03803 family)
MIILKGKAHHCGSSMPPPPSNAALPVAIALLVLLFANLSAQGQTFTLLYLFRGSGDGAEPAAGVIRDSSGNLYGTTQFSGSFGFGTVFEINADGKESVLHSFWGGDGLWPIASLIRDEAGNFYGTAYEGGTLEGGVRGCEHGCGSVFKLDRAGKSTLLYGFTGGTDGGAPRGVIRDSNGNLYGTTQGGGSFSSGTVFKINADGKETVLYAFAGSATDGSWPIGGLVRDEMGNLYGVTLFGKGAGCAQRTGCGTVFKVDPDGKETLLHNFTGGADGAYPEGPLVLDSAGNLYGVTAAGGSPTCTHGFQQNCGVVFKVDKNGREAVLHWFGQSGDGARPSGALLRDKAGSLYGVTSYGGSRRRTQCDGNDGCGTIFKVDARGHETVLYSFAGGGVDGKYPNGGLVRDKAGNLYGTMQNGGVFTESCPGGSCGLVFKLAP